MSTEQRPPIWIGHVTLRTPCLDESETFMKAIGLRGIVHGENVAVLELRGGTHLVLIRDEDSASAQGVAASFDFMVEDLIATRDDFVAQGLTVSEIEHGRIHDAFRLTEPGGNVITVNSTHVPDHALV